jgi:hypothetical protein
MMEFIRNIVIGSANQANGNSNYATALSQAEVVATGEGQRYERQYANNAAHA